MHKRALWLVILSAILATVCVLFARVTSRAPFAYDEADYMWAGTQGFWANYVDRNSLALVAYVRKGLELAHDEKQRVTLSEYVRASGDIDFYRHYHGPAYAYWIALWHRLGAADERTYRAAGLLLHAATTLAIFWLFLRVFPGYRVESAFLAAAAFAMNRTALVTATTITQHVLFEMLAIAALFAIARFSRTGNARNFYAAAVLVALAFAAVETAVVLIGTAAVTAAIVLWSSGWKSTLAIVAKASAWFTATLAFTWPMGLLHLNSLKGFLYLAYMARYRKTLSPITPAELWGFKLWTYPFEFVLLVIAAVAGLILFPRLTDRRSATPFLVYAAMFFGVTLVITIPYTHYHSSFIASLAVVTGIVFGELSERSRIVVRATAFSVAVASLVALDITYYRERVAEQAAPPTIFARALEMVRHDVPPRSTIVAPQYLIPTLHYYRPGASVIAYDARKPRLERFIATPGQSWQVFCTQTLCTHLQTAPDARVLLSNAPIGTVPDSDEPVFAATIYAR